MSEELLYKISIPVLIALVGGLIRVGVLNRLEKIESEVGELTDPKTGVRAELAEVRLEIARTIPTVVEMEQEITKALRPLENKLDHVQDMLSRLVK